MRGMFRVLAVLLLALPAAAWAQLPVQVGERDAYVQARLILVERSPGCGLSIMGSRALYEVEYGPPGMQGEPLEVIVACIELPMTRWLGVGDLKTFVPGELHYLHVSRDNVHGVGAYDDRGGRAWFLLAASRTPLLRTAADADREAYVRARLILVERSPGCGNIVFGSRALYAVEEGPDGLKGGPLEVVVPCIEMPMTDWQGMGDLENFVPDDIHYLRISRDNVRQVEAYDDRGGRAWHLLAASLRPLAGAEASAQP